VGIRTSSLGHTSLFTFLHRELGLSKGASHFRKVAAELLQRYPEVVDPLRDGRLCITSVVELAKVITPENRLEVLPRFFHTSKKEAKEISAEIRPQEAAPHRLVVTTLKPASAPSAALARMLLPELSVRSGAVEAGSAMESPRVRPDEPPRARLPMVGSARAAPPAVEPLTADLRRLHVTVSMRFTQKLEAARDALSHSHPGADVETILEAGLDLLLERAAKRKGLVKRPRPAAVPAAGAVESANPRHVPAAVRREVFLRDEGKCQWPLADGGICGSTHQVELDHIVPVGRGGKSTASQMRTPCRFHNDLAAREVYGDELMYRFTRGAGRPPTQHAARHP
jgi:hypothetical protein